MALIPRKPFDFELASGLSPEEIETVRREATEEAEKELKAERKKTLKAKFTEDAKRAKGLLEEQVEVTIDLAPYCDRILIDNRAFFQGQTYILPLSQARSMWEIMQRTWQHQSEIDGKSENFYRKNRSMHVNASGGVVRA